MVDVIFRDVDAATLDRLLGVLHGVKHEVQDNTRPPWSVEAAEEVLRRATTAGSRLARAIIDSGGVITVEAAARATDPIAPYHASGSLLRRWRQLQREARYVAAGAGVPAPWDQPIEPQQVKGKLSGYRMRTDVVEVFEQALRRLGR